MDAVILAGGKSERLRGIVPPYHKPFIVVNGRSLLVAAVEEASKYAKRVVVVATGENAMPVWQLIGHHDHVRVVLSDRGVGHALWQGLEVTAAYDADDRSALVLMSDNVFGFNDIADVATNSYPYAIGTRILNRIAAQRYTCKVNGVWQEGAPLLPVSQDDFVVWSGPLVIDRFVGLTMLEGKDKIGPYLGPLTHDGPCVPVETIDIGTPEAARRITERINV